MLKELILKYGKAKINTLTKYPSILTLHRMGEKGKLTDELSTDISGETMFASEKIDGTNVRLIVGSTPGEYLIGSRENILYHSDDLYFDPAQGIVSSIQSLLDLSREVYTKGIMAIYGELYGGKISANSKQYGAEAVGFRVFDIALINDLAILDCEIDEISRWRETETPTGIRYGQPFVSIDALSQCGFDLVPSVQFEFDDLSHQSIYTALKQCLPKTRAALTETAGGKPEGIVLRNSDRSKIVKIRFEDYERTLK